MAVDVSIRGLSYAVPGGPVLLDRIGLAAVRGEMLAIVGPNGAGKTTLLRCIYGAIRPSAGEILVGGTDAARLSARARARLVAAVPQETGIDVPLTVREVVEAGRTAHAGRWLGRDPAGANAVKRALAQVGLDDLSNRHFPTLSGGERRRTLIARALAQEPQVLVLDEPTNHLDLRHQLELMTLLRTLGLTVIVTLHDVELAARYCDRLVVLSDGRVDAIGRPREVLTAPLMARVFRVAAHVSHDAPGESLRIHADLPGPANDQGGAGATRTTVVASAPLPPSNASHVANLTE